MKSYQLTVTAASPLSTGRAGEWTVFLQGPRGAKFALETATPEAFKAGAKVRIRGLCCEMPGAGYRFFGKAWSFSSAKSRRD